MLWQNKKKQDCLERTEKAISKVIQNQEKLSFHAIAREAGVSVSCIYKYIEIKEHIQDTRDRQVKEANLKQEEVIKKQTQRRARSN